jgi:RimJ/RimL family protein N-acetyltransferase
MALRTVTNLDRPEIRPAASQPFAYRQPVLNLRGDLVGLGPLQQDLLDTYERWLNDFDLLAMLDRRFRPLTSDWIRTWYERQSRANGDTLVFTIWDLATSTAIGNAALQDIDPRTRTAEFGIFIADAEYRGEGRGTEATRLLLRFAFETLSLENVMLRVYAYNERALKVYERVGFKIIGRRRGAQRRWGRSWDTLLMDITPAEFIERNSEVLDLDVVLSNEGRA